MYELEKVGDGILPIDTLKLLDSLLGSEHTPTKDSEGDSRKVYTKTYVVIIKNPHPRVLKLRLWFDETRKVGTLKVKAVPYKLLVAAGSYTLVQAGVLIQQAFATPK